MKYGGKTAVKTYLLPHTGTFYKANLHTHTTLSDGKFTPEEVKAAYAERGYSIVAFTDHEIFLPHNDLTDETFLALNAHEVSISESADKSKRARKTYHLNFYAKSPDVTVSPLFSESRVFFASTKPLVTDEMRAAEPLQIFYSVDSINHLIRVGNENGFFVNYNHPIWSLQQYPDYIGLKGLFGIEVYNNACARMELKDSCVPFDDLLRAGNDLFPICSDDSHKDVDRFGGWTMVKAEKLTYECVIDALLSGAFYSTTGPEIMDLWIENGTLFVRASKDCSAVKVVTDWRADCQKRHFPEDVGDANLVTVPIVPFAKKYCERNYPDWEGSYFRLEVEGEGGKCAYTRAFRFDDLKEIL